MYRLKEDHEDELDIKKSRFICYLHKTFDEQDAKDFITMIKKMHPNATHHCYAFVIGEHDEIKRSNDDGEPSGTAGVPMLECLTLNHMQDIVAVVVRYFGGIKLGAGGLIRAYSKSVSHALKSATVTQKQVRKRYEVRFSYDLIGKVDYLLRQEEADVLDKIYEEDVTYIFLTKESLDAKFQELTNGKYIPEHIQDEIIDVEIQLEEDEEE